MMLITTLVVSFLVCCILDVRCSQAGVVSGLQAKAGYSSLIASNIQHTANQERNDQCGNGHHSCELLMMGIVVPETCSACKKYNKIISGIQLFFYSSDHSAFIVRGSSLWTMYESEVDNTPRDFIISWEFMINREITKSSNTAIAELVGDWERPQHDNCDKTR